MRGEPDASPSSGSGEEQKPASPNFVTRAGRLLLSQRADFSTIGATGVCACMDDRSQSALLHVGTPDLLHVHSFHQLAPPSSSAAC